MMQQVRVLNVVVKYYRWYNLEFSLVSHKLEHITKPKKKGKDQIVQRVKLNNDINT